MVVRLDRLLSPLSDENDKRQYKKKNPSDGILIDELVMWYFTEEFVSLSLLQSEIVYS